MFSAKMVDVLPASWDWFVRASMEWSRTTAKVDNSKGKPLLFPASTPNEIELILMKEWGRRNPFGKSVERRAKATKGSQ
jgi:hypothetical protein